MDVLLAGKGDMRSAPKFAREKQRRVRALARALVLSVSPEAAAEDGNRKTAEKFVAEGLAYHRFLDSHPDEVRALYSGLVETLQTHALDARAEALRQRVQLLTATSPAGATASEESAIHALLCIAKLAQEPVRHALRHGDTESDGIVLRGAFGASSTSDPLAATREAREAAIKRELQNAADDDEMREATEAWAMASDTSTDEDLSDTESETSGQGDDEDAHSGLEHDKRDWSSDKRDVSPHSVYAPAVRPRRDAGPNIAAQIQFAVKHRQNNPEIDPREPLDLGVALAGSSLMGVAPFDSEVDAVRAALAAAAGCSVQGVFCVQEATRSGEPSSSAANTGKTLVFIPRGMRLASLSPSALAAVMDGFAELGSSVLTLDECGPLLRRGCQVEQGLADGILVLVRRHRCAIATLAAEALSLLQLEHLVQRERTALAVAADIARTATSALQAEPKRTAAAHRAQSVLDSLVLAARDAAVGARDSVLNDLLIACLQPYARLVTTIAMTGNAQADVYDELWFQVTSDASAWAGVAARPHAQPPIIVGASGASAILSAVRSSRVLGTLPRAGSAEVPLSEWSMDDKADNAVVSVMRALGVACSAARGIVLEQASALWLFAGDGNDDPRVAEPADHGSVSGGGDSEDEVLEHAQRGGAGTEASGAVAVVTVGLALAAARPQRGARSLLPSADDSARAAERLASTQLGAAELSLERAEDKTRVAGSASACGIRAAAAAPLVADRGAAHRERQRCSAAAPGADSDLRPVLLSDPTAAFLTALSAEGALQSRAKLARYMVDEQSVLQHLEVVRRVMLLGDGEIADALAAALAEPGALADAHEVNRALAGALEGTGVAAWHRWTDDADGLFVAELRRDAVADGGTRAVPHLESLSLSCTPPWPLDIVVDASAMERYNEIFRFLLFLRMSLFHVERVQRAMMLDSDARAVRVAALPADHWERCSIVAQLSHVARNLATYFFSRVMHGPWEDLERAVRTASSVDELITAHAAYLARMRDLCMLNERAAVVRDALRRVLALPFRLASGDAPATIGGDLARAVRFLVSIVDRIARSGTHPHLEDLLHRITFNGFFAAGEQ